MSLRTDQRGQAIQVGAVLLFAVLIVAFSSYQAVIIPEDNRRVEFNHNQEVQEHLGELRSAVLGAADSRSVRSVTVALGTTYPSRTLGLNPGPPGGSLRTVGTDDPMVNLTIENAVASGETGDFWNGTARAYNTGGITYEPIYNRYDEAPTTAYEHSLLYNRFPGSNTLVLGNQTLVDDGRLSIVTVNGSIDRTSSRSTTVDVRPMSGSGTRVAVTSADSPITLNFSSRLSWEHWNASIPNRHTVSAGAFPSPEGYHSITVELAEREQGYRLGMAKAAVGQGATGEDEAYLTTREPRVGPVPRGTNRTLTLTVRDRYNNPVSGVEVDAAVGENDGGSLDATMDHSDADGTVSFEYRANESTAPGRHPVNFTIEDGGVPGSSFNRSTPENVTIDVDVSERGGGGGAYSVDWTNPSGEDENSGANLSCGDGTCTWDVADSDDDTILLNTTLSPPFEGIDLEFAVDGANVGTLSTNSRTSGSDGAATTELTAEENGTVEVLGSGNEGSDTIEIELTNVNNDGNNPPEPPTTRNGIRYDGNLGTTGSTSGIQFDVTNVDNSFARITAVNIQGQGGDIEYLYNADGREIVVTGGQVMGYASDQSRADEAYVTDNRTISFTQTAVLTNSDSDRTGTVTIRDFGSRPNPTANSFTEYDFSGLQRVSGTESWDVAITLQFQNRGDVIYFFQEV